jgi:hypothetical protein
MEDFWVVTDSTPAHESDDLEIVAVFDDDLSERRARDDFEIPLNRDAAWLEAELKGQIRDGHPFADPAMLAVHSDRGGFLFDHDPAFALQLSRPYRVEPWPRHL